MARRRPAAGRIFVIAFGRAGCLEWNLARYALSEPRSPSRPHGARIMTHRRTAAAWALVVALLAAATPLLGQASKTAPTPPAKPSLDDVLATEIDTRNFGAPE